MLYLHEYLVQYAIKHKMYSLLQFIHKYKCQLRITLKNTNEKEKLFVKVTNCNRLVVLMKMLSHRAITLRG